MSRTRALFAAAAACLLMLQAANAAQAASAVRVSASIDGRQLIHEGSAHSVPLHPSQFTRLRLAVTNDSRLPVRIRTVRMRARVLGITMFGFNTSVRMDLAPGASDTLSFTLDTADLRNQATGLLPATLSVVAADGNALGSRKFVADVAGSAHSTYAIFGIVLAVIAALTFLAALLALARNRLSANRWSRGLRFLAPGIALGLLIVIAASLLRVAAPTLTLAIPIIVVCGGGFLLLGYLTPTPDYARDGEPTDGDDYGEDFGDDDFGGQSGAWGAPTEPSWRVSADL